MLNGIDMKYGDFVETVEKNLCAKMQTTNVVFTVGLHSIDKSLYTIYDGLTEHQRFMSSSLSSCHRVNDEKSKVKNNRTNTHTCRYHSNCIERREQHWAFNIRCTLEYSIQPMSTFNELYPASMLSHCFFCCWQLRRRLSSKFNVRFNWN